MMSVESPDKAKWWESAVIYEIALISFQDSNDDGKGDLAGLMSRIDYLKWLGVDAVWLTPIYKSPFRDLSYDISDYCSADYAFGSLEEFDHCALVHTANKNDTTTRRISNPSSCSSPRRSGLPQA